MNTLARRHLSRMLLILGALALLACGKKESGLSGGAGAPTEVTLLNVSYDPTREFYEEFNAAFAKHWLATKNQEVTVKQSHGGSGKQARAVIDGLEADVITLALAHDIDQVKKAGLIVADWQTRLKGNASPYTSTIVFLVRKGNPKGIKDWGDLVRPGVQVITANPKTSGGARWNYLAAWGYALKQNGNDEGKAREFVTQLYKNVPVLDSGARGSTTTFVERGIGDVLVGWENEALLGIKSLGPDKFEIVNPSVSIVAEPPVAVVDKYAEKHGTKEVAMAYLQYLYSPEGQALAAKHYFRATDPDTAARDNTAAKNAAAIELFGLTQYFGDWSKAQQAHFADNAQFDQIFSAAKK